MSEVFASWLSEYEWDYFATFTFEMPRRSSGILPVTRWWARMAANSPSVSGRAFIADEMHRDGERVHVHALLHSDPQAWQQYLWGSWRKHWGRERILRFDKSKGAAWYCSKYLIKDQCGIGEWKFVEWIEGQLSDGSDIPGQFSDYD